MEGNSDMAIDEKKHRIIWLDEYCEYCGEQLNSWDKRVAKVLYITILTRKEKRKKKSLKKEKKLWKKESWQYIRRYLKMVGILWII